MQLQVCKVCLCGFMLWFSFLVFTCISVGYCELGHQYSSAICCMKRLVAEMTCMCQLSAVFSRSDSSHSSITLRVTLLWPGF